MATASDLLVPIGIADNTKWYTDAQSWTRQQILDWLDGKSKEDRPGDQGAALKALLQAIYLQLRALCLPDGPDYLKPTPICHIKREPNPELTGKTQKEKNKLSAFNLLDIPGDHIFGQAMAPGVFFTPYDLLGFFLSLLGPAPYGAGKLNYFLPLTAAYAVWCSKLAGDLNPIENPKPPKGVGGWPICYQCTWAVVEEADPKAGTKPCVEYFLGASISGDSKGSGSRAHFLRKRQQRRFDVMLKFQVPDMVGPNDFDNFKEGLTGDANRPGNCGETYPFTRMLKSKTENGNMHGLALGLGFMVEEVAQPTPTSTWQLIPPPYTMDRLTSCLYNPCGTCAVLLQKAGANPHNFAK